MWSQYKTLTPLHTITQRMNVHPLTIIGASLDDCGLVPPHYCAFDNLPPGELLDRLAMSVQSAERLFYQLTGWSAAPQYECETVRYPKSRRCQEPMKQGKGCDFKAVEVCDNELITVGKRGLDEVQLNAPITYLDLNNDCYHETAQIVIESDDPMQFEACGIQVFFAGNDGNDRYRVQPIKSKLSDDGLTLTITIPTHCLIKPEVLKNRGGSEFSFDCELIDLSCQPDDTGQISDDCPLVKTVDIYYEYIDSECPVDLHYVGCDDLCGRCNACATTTLSACTQDTGLCNRLRLVPSEKVNVGTDDNPCYECKPLTGCNARMDEPTTATINYLGGRLTGDKTDCYNAVHPAAAEFIYWLSLAWMRYDVCGCKCELQEIVDAQKVVSNDNIPGFVVADANNSRYSGTISQVVTFNRYGELRAWGIIKPYLNSRCR